MSPFSLGILGSAHVPAAAGGGTIDYLAGGSTATNSAASLTVSGLNFGTAAADRVLIAAVGVRTSNGRVFSSITIGGVAATIDHKAGSWFDVAGIARASVPTGTSGNVTITMDGADFGPRHVALYVAYGTVSVDAVAGHYSNAATSTASISNGAGRSLVAVAANSSGATAWAWTGPTEDFESISGTSSASAAHANGVAAGPTTVTAVSTGGATYQTLVAVSYTIT